MLDKYCIEFLKTACFPKLLFLEGGGLEIGNIKSGY